MSWIERILTLFEARLRIFVEGDASRDGFPRRLHRQLERELVHAMKSGIRNLPNEAPVNGGSLTAPDQYTLVLPAIDAQILLTHPSELDRLTRTLETSAMQAGLRFGAPPVLRVVADPQSTNMSILFEFCQPGDGDSSTYQLEEVLNGSRQSSTEQLPSAFLIVNGLSTFTIKSPVVNIGFDPCNQLQLNDPHISPRHAQLRLVQGRFVIFDLDSHSGTFVNGVPVSSHVLKPGDVIQLASLPLVFGQESTGLSEQTQQLPAGPTLPEVL